MSILVALVVIFIAYFAYDTMRTWGLRGPRRVPFLGNLPQLIAYGINLHDYYADLFRKYDTRTIFMRVATDDWYVTCDRANVEHMLKTKWENYTVAAGPRAEMMEEIFGDGIFRAHGAMWQEQRKTASREFSANKFRTFMGVVFAEESTKMCNIIAAHAKSATAFDIADLCFRYTMDSFGRIGFDADLGSMDGTPVPFTTAFDLVQEHTSWRSIGVPPPVWKTLRALNLGKEATMRKNLDICDTFVHGLIAQRRALPAAERAERVDLLSRLMDITDCDSKRTRAQNDKLLRDMVLNYFVAGRDTTACGIMWFLYELAKDAALEKRLWEEVHTHLGDSTPNWDNVKDCHYLQACLSETQRLHPSVPEDPKTVLQEDVLPSGHRVKPGDTVMYSNYSMGRDPEYWGPDPLVFRPERWLDKDGVYQRADPYMFPAFQAGPRMCLGIDMATLEMKVIVAMIVQRFQLRLVPGRTVHYRVTVVMPILNGLWVTAEPRQK